MLVIWACCLLARHAGVYALLGGSWSAAVPKALSAEALLLASCCLAQPIPGVAGPNKPRRLSHSSPQGKVAAGSRSDHDGGAKSGAWSAPEALYNQTGNGRVGGIV